MRKDRKRLRCEKCEEKCARCSSLAAIEAVKRGVAKGVVLKNCANNFGIDK